MKNKKIAVAISIVLTGAPVFGLQAKEGADQYPFGAETWLAGAAPPAGFYLINYTAYHSGDLRNGDGKKTGDTASYWFTALRLVQMTDYKILGGNWGWQAILPVIHQDVDLLGVDRSTTDIGDVSIDPFLLTWHGKNIHWLVGVDFSLPTGHYKEGVAQENTGANYYSAEPFFSFTYLNDTGWEVSSRIAYNKKTKNSDYRPAADAPRMDYQSGDEFHVDYLLGKRFGPVGIGLSGYYMKQTTDDELEDDTIPGNPLFGEGRRGQVFAIGPTVSFTTKGGVLMSAQWNHESHVENRFGGDKFMLKFIVPL